MRLAICTSVLSTSLHVLCSIVDSAGDLSLNYDQMTVIARLFQIFKSGLCNIQTILSDYKYSQYQSEFRLMAFCLQDHGCHFVSTLKRGCVAHQLHFLRRRTNQDSYSTSWRGEKLYGRGNRQIVLFSIDKFINRLSSDAVKFGNGI